MPSTGSNAGSFCTCMGRWAQSCFRCCHIQRLARRSAPPVLTLDCLAWFDVAAGTLSDLEQRQEWRKASIYAYGSPTTDYAAELLVSPMGFVTRIPLGKPTQRPVRAVIRAAGPFRRGPTGPRSPTKRPP